MAVIKEGYNSKPLHIRISGRENDNAAELWLEQQGLLSENPELARYRETLSYATAEELRELKNEIEAALKVMFGLK